MARESARARGIFAMLDRMGEFHRRIVLEPLEQFLQGRIVLALDHVVIFRPARNADEISVSQRALVTEEPGPSPSIFSSCSCTLATFAAP